MHMQVIADAKKALKASYYVREGANHFCGIVLIFMGMQAFFVGGYLSKSWGRYIVMLHSLG